MEYKLPPLPDHPEPRVMTWSKLEQRTIIEFGEACYAAAIEAQGVPDCKVVDVGFRWDADRQEHVPSIKVEFEPVKAGSPNTEKGWKDRDALVTMLASAHPAQQAKPQPLSDEQIKSMCKQTWVFETVKQWVRIIEATHGIQGS